ncbi:hypothetical protein PP713_08545 [Mycobacterium sp. CSUR Q5927]|nr:hypothetical protein [Mycobacterium sp. CSUR Q5927]
MNASADGEEPLGEHVEVTMPHTVRMIDLQAQALKAVRELHQPGEPDALGMFANTCTGCSIPNCGIAVSWPCPTVRAITNVLGC